MSNIKQAIKQMTPTFIFVMLAIAGLCIIAGIICDSKSFKEYKKWAKLAEEELNVGPEEFSRYMEFAKELYGSKATPEDAYYIAFEEWRDLNFK